MLVFISHAQEDQPIVDEICRYLKQLGIDYWMDKAKLHPDQNWKAQVQKVLPRVDVVLFCMSKQSQLSESVKWELEQAKALNRTIKKVKVANCEVNEPDQKDILYFDLAEPKRLIENLINLGRELLGPSLNPVPRIFINYRNGADPKDQELASYLNRELYNHGVDVWSDMNEIGPSESWGKTIKRAIDTSDWMIIVVSKTSMQSRRVDAVWREFINQGKESQIILAMTEMTNVNFKLRSCHYVNFGALTREHWDTKGLPQLASILQEAGARLAPPFVIEETPSEQPKPLEWYNDHGTLYLITPQAIQPRHKFSKPDAMIQKATKEIWISGISMTKVAQTDLYHFLVSPQENDRRMRFMVLDPQYDPCLQDASGYLGTDMEKLRRRIQLSLDYLCELKIQADKAADRVEIRVMKYRPSNGYFIIDPTVLETGTMTISPYLSEIDNVELYKSKKQSRNDLEPPFIYLTRLADQQSFDVFCEDFERSWNTAVPWPICPKPEK